MRHEPRQRSKDWNLKSTVGQVKELELCPKDNGESWKCFRK